MRGVFVPQLTERSYLPCPGRYGMLLSISVAVVVPKTSSAFARIFGLWQRFYCRSFSGRGIIAATRVPGIGDPGVLPPEET